MNVWTVLGINQTKDKDEIKKAYRRLLSKTNPEDNPEGFMELRAAYEEGIRLADEGEVLDDNTAEDGITGKLKALYNDFSRRIDKEEWLKLFDEDEFVALDTSEEAFVTMMKFLMDNFYLPKEIWKTICDTFDIASRRKELKSIFPDDFIEYAINNSIYEDVIDYKLFEGDESQYDRYIEIFYKLDIAVRKRDVDQQQDMLAKLNELDVYHPYIEVMQIRNEIQKIALAEAADTSEQLEELQNKAHSLYEAFPEDIIIINCCGDVALFKEDYEEAGKYYNISRQLAPDNYIVKGKMAELYYYTGEFEKSRDLYMELLKINHYDNNVRAGMMRANQGLIDKNMNMLKLDPDNNKLRIEMAWSYYQSYKFDEAIKILDEFMPDEEQVFEYNNLKGRNYLCVEEYENALTCFFEWKKAIEALDENDREAADKRKRYEYVNFLIGDCYLKLGKYDEARKYFDIALSKEHDEIILSNEAYCELEYKCGNMEACLNACDRLLELDQRSYIAYDYMSKAYYEMGYVHETLNACERAISIYPYICIPYEMEINILLNLEQYDAAKAVLERYRSFKLESDRMDLIEAKLYDRKGEVKKAVELMEALNERANINDSDVEEFSDIKMYLGSLYEKQGQIDRAIEVYQEIVNSDKICVNACGRLGMIYRSREQHDLAIELFTKELEINECVFYLVQRAILYKFIGNLDEAKEDYIKSIRLEGGDAFIHSRLGLIYEQTNEFENAISEFDKAIEAIKREMEYDKAKEKISQILLFKARTYQCMNDFDNSYKVYLEYIEDFGIKADVAYDYAELLSRMGKTDEAIKLLKKCVEILPYDEDLQTCIRQLIGICGDEGYLDKANEAFLLAIDKNKEDARAYASIARVLKTHGLYKEAKKYYEKAVEYSDEGENYYNELIEVLFLSKQTRKNNIDNLNELGNFSEDELKIPYYMIKLAKRYIAKKEYEKAIDVLDNAIKARRCNGCFYGQCHEAFFEKGIIYEALKAYLLAGKCYKEAAKICGHNCLYEDKIKGIEKNDSRD